MFIFLYLKMRMKTNTKLGQYINVSNLSNLGWGAPTSLIEGIKKTYDSFLLNES